VNRKLNTNLNAAIVLLLMLLWLLWADIVIITVIILVIVIVTAECKVAVNHTNTQTDRHKSILSLLLQTAAKLLQTRSLMTAYTNLPAPYPAVISMTPYNILFSHNTFCYK